MVRQVGIREFKNRFGEILREVEEGQEEVAITRRGREVVRLVPAMRRPVSAGEMEKWIERSHKLAEEIGRLWPKGVSAGEAISEDRNRLERG